MSRVNKVIGDCDVFGFLAALNYSLEDIAGLYIQKTWILILVRQDGREATVRIFQTDEKSLGACYQFMAEQSEHQIVNDVTTKLHQSRIFGESQYYREILPVTKAFEKGFKALNKAMKAHAKAFMRPSEEFGYQFTR
ncbi:hypothetical protein LZ656_17495 [Leclercia adecarboxylata]|uniref:hypothetical protein n=1 Tax=Leclercia adecarboxylata TaxID=83655 RepID=UPI000980D177|nr:hypothetical protein [Leclercia adecarboxylata]MCE9984169.1 hypothetical protein [Leclercia adecarboxylata]OOB84498.1 hypothetical protein BZY71_24445 [Leclercia adecarboxylata]